MHGSYSNKHSAKQSTLLQPWHFSQEALHAAAERLNVTRCTNILQSKQAAGM